MSGEVAGGGGGRFPDTVWESPADFKMEPGKVSDLIGFSGIKSTLPSIHFLQRNRSLQSGYKM